MSYTKTVWTDRQVPRPLTFQYPLVNNGDGTTTLVPAEGTPTAAGTPITASALNNIENGIANVDSRLTTVEGVYLNKTGDTMTGTLIITKQGDGAELLRFNTERPWSFYQRGTGASTTLDLRSSSLGKTLTVTTPGGAVLFSVYANSETVNGGGNQIKTGNNTLDDGSGNVTIAGTINASGSLVFHTNGSADNIVLSGGSIQNTAGTGNITVNAGSGAGYVILQSPTDKVYLQSPSAKGVHVVAPSTTSTYVPINASAFTVNSNKDSKKNITPFTENSESIVNNTTIYQYNYNNESDIDMKHTGLILQDSPVEVVDPSGVGIDIYAMVSVLWKAVQELSAKVSAIQSGQAATPSSTSSSTSSSTPSSTPSSTTAS